MPSWRYDARHADEGGGIVTTGWSKAHGVGALLLALAGCAQQNTPDDLSPAPGRALLILSVNQVSPSSALYLSPYDAAQHSISVGFLGGSPGFDLGRLSDHGFIWKQVDAGTYVVSLYAHQTNWGLCFAGRSLALTVAPGEKIYLGRIDAAFYNQALAREIVAHGNTSLPRSKIAHYFDMVPPVGFDMTTPYNADGTLNVTSGTAVAGVVPAVWRAATFKTGYSLTGDRVCGGYFRT
jgi:hypothetical protein